MIYLSVVKNATTGEWEILRVIPSIYNVRGNSSNMTYSDITMLSLETRKIEGFWTQEYISQNDGEYMVFKETVITFDEDRAVVVNTYVYELMPLDDIKADLKNRAVSKRESLHFSTFSFQGNTFQCGASNRSNIQLMMISALIDETNFPTNLVWDTVDGVSISMDLETFKLFTKELADFTRSIFIKTREIKLAIDAATTYAEARTAANWDGESL